MSSDNPFDAGPYPWLTHARVLRFVEKSAWRCLLSVAVVTWLPLVLLAALQGHALSPNPHESLLQDARVYVRYLVAAPLFVLAATVYLPELALTVRTFVDAEIIAKHDLPRYRALVISTQRLLDSRVTDAVLLLLAYGVTFTVTPRVGNFGMSTWARAADGHLFLAGWWRLLVSQPLFLALLGVWLWRLLLWIRFLWTVAQMDLRLVAGHPDQRGGLRFVLLPIRGFSILAFAMGALGAGAVAQAVLIDGRLPVEFRLFVGAQVLTGIGLFGGPVLLLTLPLLRLQARGTIEYGQLASRVGRQFEKRWVNAGRREVDPETLEVPDFSATTDLYGVVGNIRNINPFVLGLRHVIVLAVASLLPYVPIAFAVMPFDEIVKIALTALS